MAVTASYTPARSTGNGVTVNFAAAWPLFAATEILVTLFDTSLNALVSPQPVLNGAGTYDYTVTLGSQDTVTLEYASATVTFNNAPLGNHRIILQRQVAATQPNIFSESTRFPAASVGQMGDRAIMALQQASVLIGLAVQAPPTDPAGLTYTLPIASQRALKYVFCDVNGSFTMSDATVPGGTAGLSATSTSSVAIATGAKTFTATTGKLFAAGQFVTVSDAANAANYMHGAITSYDAIAGTLVVNVLDIGGSGTKASWNINVSGTQGTIGPTGLTGTGLPIVAAGGTVDAITAAFSPAITLTDQVQVCIVAAGANTSTTPSFTPNGLTGHTITKGGGAALRAGDIAGAGYVGILEYNLANTRWELLNPATGVASTAQLNVTGQSLTGGATVTPFDIGTVSSGTTTLDCGKGPLHKMTNNGASTIAAPAADGAIVLLVTNGASAGALTFSGFTVSSNTGDALTTTNANKFMISVVRINSVSNYTIRALQ